MLNKLTLWLPSLSTTRARTEQELDAELRFHLEKEIEENIRRGMSAEEARYAALRSFGGVDQVKEECRDLRGDRFFEALLQDIRYGVRVQRHDLRRGRSDR